jgi:hypothetical protein
MWFILKSIDCWSIVETKPADATLEQVTEKNVTPPFWDIRETRT